MAVTRHEARGNAREPDGGNAGTHEMKANINIYAAVNITSVLNDNEEILAQILLCSNLSSSILFSTISENIL